MVMSLVKGNICCRPCVAKWPAVRGNTDHEWTWDYLRQGNWKQMLQQVNRGECAKVFYASKCWHCNIHPIGAVILANADSQTVNSMLEQCHDSKRTAFCQNLLSAAFPDLLEKAFKLDLPDDVFIYLLERRPELVLCKKALSMNPIICNLWKKTSAKDVLKAIMDAYMKVKGAEDLNGWSLFKQVAGLGGWKIPEDRTHLMKITDIHGRNWLQACLEEQLPDHVTLHVLRADPNLAKSTDMFGRLPFHYALAEKRSEIVVLALLNAYPYAAKEMNLYGHQSLHLSLGLKFDRLTVAILKHFPETASAKNMSGQLPLQVAIKFGASSMVLSALLLADPKADVRNLLLLALNHAVADEVILSILKLCPEAAKVAEHGKLPLHQAILDKRSDSVLMAILEAYPKAVKKLYRDQTPLSMAIQHKRSSSIVLSLLNRQSASEQASALEPCSREFPLHAAILQDYDDDVLCDLYLAHPDALTIDWPKTKMSEGKDLVPVAIAQSISEHCEVLHLSGAETNEILVNKVVERLSSGKSRLLHLLIKEQKEQLSDEANESSIQDKVAKLKEENGYEVQEIKFYDEDDHKKIHAFWSYHLQKHKAAQQAKLAERDSFACKLRVHSDFAQATASVPSIVAEKEESGGNAKSKSNGETHSCISSDEGSKSSGISDDESAATDDFVMT